MRSHASVGLRVALVGALCALSVWGVVVAHRWAADSKTFALVQVSFDGLHRATEPELLKLGGLALGTNLFHVNPEMVAQALGTHPWVRHVTVQRLWPHSVRVSVEEHTPEAMAVLNELYLLNGHGEPFKKVHFDDQLDLPLVTGITRDAYMKDPVATAARFRDALGLIAAYQASPASRGEPLSEVRVEGKALALVTGEGQDVELGEGDYGSKLERLARVRQELRAKSLAAAAVRLDNRARPGWVAVELSQRASP